MFVIVYGVIIVDIIYSWDDVRSIEGDVLYFSCFIIVNIFLKCDNESLIKFKIKLFLII